MASKRTVRMHCTNAQGAAHTRRSQHDHGSGAEGEGELLAALHRLEKHIRKTKLKLTFAEQLGVLRNAADAVRRLMDAARA